MLNILIILGGLGNEGITNSVLTYLENLNKEGLNITLGVAGVSIEQQKKRAEAIGIKVAFLPGRNTNSMRYFFSLIKIIKKEKFDIVHVHGNSATLGIDMLAAKLAGAKVRIAHSRNTSCTHPLADKIMRPLFNLTYTEGFACGEDAGKWLFGDKPFTIIPNGKKIDKYLFNEDTRVRLRNELKIDDKTIAIGHIGVFNEQKNHTFLVDIIAELVKKDKRYTLFLFGTDNGTMAHIKEKIESNRISDHVVFMGYKQNVNEYLSAMDIMLFPSLYEGLPNVVIEWQMAGLPCLISNTITKECVVMDNVKMLPINEGTDIWVKEILQCAIGDRSETIAYVKDNMSSAGYNIEKNVELLREKYYELGNVK